MPIKIKRGDRCLVPVTVTMGGESLPMGDVETVEFCLGKVRKLWPGEVEVEESGRFLVPLSQADTFTLPPDCAARLDVRVRFRGGAVIGAEQVVMAVTLDAVSDREL